jgi:hypothetical protein
LAQEFISSGIDDLAKYHIVRLLCEYQSLAGDAALYAAYLGFHSVAVTITLLDELVASGILRREDRGRGDRPRYRLADDGELCRLTSLYNSPCRPLEHTGVLQILARRSLERARARASVAERQAEAAQDRGITASLGRNAGISTWHSVHSTPGAQG